MPNKSIAPDELEQLFLSIASHVDRLTEEEQPVFLCKAFLFLAQSCGEVSLALTALDGAAATSHIPGRAQRTREEKDGRS